MLFFLGGFSPAIMERGGYPWDVKLRSYHDLEMADELGEVLWLLNLGPTGIRARIYPDKPKHLAVQYVFQDKKSPAKGLVEIGDVIVGANGKRFSTEHRFGRNLKGGGGWDGPMMELAGHIENSQGKDGILNLTVWPQGESSDEKEVPIQLRVVGRFAETFPYGCERSNQMLEELCDFLVEDYENDTWKKSNAFHGGPHCSAHAILAMMATGNSKYDRLIKDYMSRYHGKTYDPTGGGFQMWGWGYDGIVMGEYYLLKKDRKLLPAMKSLAEAMPLGCRNGNGIYTHRSQLNLTQSGRKPYASIAAISGLHMIAMSLFKEAELPFDERLYQNIHQHYLNSTSSEAVNIAYAFGNADKLNDSDISHRHAIIKLKDKTKGLSGRGPGFTCPTGMEGIGEYEIVWPTKADHRWKPTDWIEKEADTNILTEHTGDGIRRVDRNNPKYKFAPEPTKPYKTTRTGGHLAPVGMGAVAHMIGNNPESWEYLGRHAANTCAIGPGNAFDGHATSNMHGFWSIVGAAKSDDPKLLREYLDYMKTFLILSETHNGGLILQPWGRDRPNCNSDTSYGPRVLPTATGAILLALSKKHLQITGAGSGAGGEASTSLRPKPTARPARTLGEGHLALLNEALLTSLGEISKEGKLEPVALQISKARTPVWLARVEEDWKLTFQGMKSDKQASFGFADLNAKDHALLSQLVAKHRSSDMEALGTAGIFSELSGDTALADQYFDKIAPEMVEKLGELFE
ncbi:MAG: DUF6288 domain-containing protein [Akkermansiaceae bacterium]